MQETIKKMKGQVSLIAVMITAMGTIMASVLGGWATANERVGQIDTKVQVVEERENNHYTEVQKSLTSIEKKLDDVLAKETRDKK
jgi:hypothetical protein